ncbi:hypothetical protein BH10ACI2_BH10ACI2_05110 [soil metagenome]
MAFPLLIPCFSVGSVVNSEDLDHRASRNNTERKKRPSGFRWRGLDWVQFSKIGSAMGGRRFFLSREKCYSEPRGEINPKLHGMHKTHEMLKKPVLHGMHVLTGRAEAEGLGGVAGLGRLAGEGGLVDLAGVGGAGRKM